MIAAKGAGYTYKGMETPALSGISLSVEPGERLCILGVNGSGKSTLAQLMAGLIFAAEGTVEVDGTPLSPQTAISLSRTVGFVAQDPRSQLVSALVFDEVSFGLRYAGLHRKQIRSAAMEALARCGIRYLAGSSTAELSGGQQQLVSIASALASSPSYLVLDEPTSMLDTATSKEICFLIDSLVADGVGVAEVSHDLLRAMGAHRICLIDKGALTWEGSFSTLLANDALLGTLGCARHPLVALLRAVEREGFRFGPGTEPDDLVSYVMANRLARRVCEAIRPQRNAGEDAPSHELALEDAGVVYDAHAALRDVTLRVGDELVIVAGSSGSGKTTCASALAGVLPLDEGRALLDGGRVRAGRVGLAMQYPQDQLFASTVREDIAYGPRNLGMEQDALDNAVFKAARAMGVDDLLDRSPFELSGGQARRAALAGIEVLDPAAVIFDEPCAGLDAVGRAQAKRLVRGMRAKHRPVIVVTHDVEEWLDIASRIIFLRNGSVAFDCTVEDAQTRTQPYRSCGIEPPLAVSVRSLAGLGARRVANHG